MSNKIGQQLIERLNEVAVTDDGTLITVDKEVRPLKWKDVIYRPLCQVYKQDQPDADNKGGISLEKKRSLAKLASKIIRAKPGLTLSASEVEDIREYVTRMWGLGVYGPVFDMLDGEYEEPVENEEV